MFQNTAFIVGYVNCDPQFTPGTNGKKSRLFFGVRTAREHRKKDSSGRWTYQYVHLPVNVWGRAADAAARYLEKGQEVSIRGELVVFDDPQRGVKRFNVVALHMSWGNKAQQGRVVELDAEPPPDGEHGDGDDIDDQPPAPLKRERTNKPSK